VAGRPYRFGIAHLPDGSRAEYQGAVSRVEELGFDFVATGDHVGRPSPFALLTAAAAVTERLRLRTYVLNTGFWVPALLAREAATLDLLSDGRLELGLGAGTARDEFEQAGLPWRPARERIAHMEETLVDVRRRLADDRHVPRPVQRPIPILVGAMSRDGLAVAAEHADIVGFSALRHARGHPPGTLTAATAEQTDELAAHVRSIANGRDFESDALLQAVELGRDPLPAARSAVEREQFDTIDPDVLAESPCVLFARTAADAAMELERRRARWGMTSFTTFAPSADALAQVRRELS
jgi:probable F420-dependent oxidoreductase